MAEVPRHADDESAPASVDDLLVSLVSSARLGVNGFSRDGLVDGRSWRHDTRGTYVIFRVDMECWNKHLLSAKCIRENHACCLYVSLRTVPLTSRHQKHEYTQHLAHATWFRVRHRACLARKRVPHVGAGRYDGWWLPIRVLRSAVRVSASSNKLNHAYRR